jgi:predicted transcriptional regulator
MTSSRRVLKVIFNWSDSLKNRSPQTVEKELSRIIFYSFQGVNSLQRVPHLPNYAYLLLTKEKWWNRTVAQRHSGKEVHTFVRKNAVGPIDAEQLLFYVSHPAREIRGVGDFEERVAGEVEELWRKYNNETVFESHEEYLDFLQGRKKATFIRFRNLRELHPPIPLKAALQTIGVARLPRNGKYLSRELANKLL